VLFRAFNTALLSLGSIRFITYTALAYFLIGSLITNL
jgi:hypothetical protein